MGAEGSSLTSRPRAWLGCVRWARHCRESSVTPECHPHLIKIDVLLRLLHLVRELVLNDLPHDERGEDGLDYLDDDLRWFLRGVSVRQRLSVQHRRWPRAGHCRLHFCHLSVGDVALGGEKRHQPRGREEDPLRGSQRDANQVPPAGVPHSLESERDPGDAPSRTMRLPITALTSASDSLPPEEAVKTTLVEAAQTGGKEQESSESVRDCQHRWRRQGTAAPPRLRARAPVVLVHWAMMKPVTCERYNIRPERRGRHLRRKIPLRRPAMREATTHQILVEAR